MINTIGQLFFFFPGEERGSLDLLPPDQTQPRPGVQHPGTPVHLGQPTLSGGVDACEMCGLCLPGHMEGGQGKCGAESTDQGQEGGTPAR